MSGRILPIANKIIVIRIYEMRDLEFNVGSVDVIFKIAACRTVSVMYYNNYIRFRDVVMKYFNADCVQY